MMNEKKDLNEKNFYVLKKEQYENKSSVKETILGGNSIL
jgi:hypothetical protein